MKTVTLEEFHEANGVVQLDFEGLYKHSITYAWGSYKFNASVSNDNYRHEFTRLMVSSTELEWDSIIDEDAEE